MRKTRISMLLNVIGMSVSLMVFLVLFAQVWHDYRFNSNFEDYRNIYRFEWPEVYPDDHYSYTSGITRPYIEAFEACSPDIEVACDYKDIGGLELEKVLYNVDGTVRTYDIPQVETDSSFPDVFSIEIIDGSQEEDRIPAPGRDKLVCILCDHFPELLLGNKVVAHSLLLTGTGCASGC